MEKSKSKCEQKASSLRMISDRSYIPLAGMNDADIIERAAKDSSVVNMGYGYENQPVLMEEIREALVDVGYDARWAGVSRRIELPSSGMTIVSFRVRNPSAAHKVNKITTERQAVLYGMSNFYDFAVDCCRQQPELVDDPNRDELISKLWRDSLKNEILGNDPTALLN